MKIAFCAGRNSPHTVRWVNGLVQRGHEILLISVHRGGDPLDPGVHQHYGIFPPGIGYFLNVPLAALALRRFAPDLLHIHSASGYGTLGRLLSFHPCVLSVWGSDVFDVPWQSSWKRKIVLRNLHQADCICSTSECMAEETRRLSPAIDAIDVIPFGIDLSVFTPRASGGSDGKKLTIGTVKRLERKYAVDVLLRAFAMVRQVLEKEKLGKEKSGSGIQLRLVIVGDGSEKKQLIALAEELDILDCTTFAGSIAHELVPEYLHGIDIFAAFSRLDSESFGVAVIEASACGLPVVVSDVSGFSEVVEHSVTGLIVPRDDISSSAHALLSLVRDQRMRENLGRNGRFLVERKYDWEHCLDQVELVYAKMLD